MLDVITISGSPSYVSKSAAILGYTRRILEHNGLTTGSIAVRDLPAEDVFFGRFNSAAVQASTTLITGAQAVIVATPIYKAAYSGLLKSFLDLLPTNILAGKVILPIATGGSSAHLLAIDYALKPVLSTLGAQHILNGVYVLDNQVECVDDEVRLDDGIAHRLQQAVDDLTGTLLRINERTFVGGV